MSNQIICPGCQAVHSVETNFCGKCGTSLVSRSRGETVPSGVASLKTLPEISAPSNVGSGPSGQASGQPATVPVQIDPWIGRLIDGRYRVLAKLGHGGMGVVYKVEHQRMGKIAAMKVLHRELLGDKEVVKRFRREAEAVSKLTHPNTVQTFDFGTADGAMYLVMEYIRGEDLGAILRRDGPLPFRRASAIFIQISNALGEAHELGIVHRDLKPENILVTRTKEGTDHVKVLDFGLAKLGEREDAAEVTGRGAIVGTPYYMSPEQIRGEHLDHRSDIYSLGAMMYRVTTGEHPFTAQTPVGVLTKHLTDEVVPPRARRPDLPIDARVEAIILRAMAKKREARYATIESIRDDLERAREELFGSSSGRQDSLIPGAVAASRPPIAGDAVGPAMTPLPMQTPSLPGESPHGERRATVEGSSVEPRLKREDFDAFERSLRRRARVRLILVPLLILAAAAAVVMYFKWQKQQPQRAEVEPNNDIEEATLISLGQPVAGSIGRRMEDGTADRDYYRVLLPAMPGSPGKLSAKVTGVPNIDVVLKFWDPVSRKSLAEADLGALGEGESIPNLAIDREVIYVRVQGKSPTESITDKYELTVDFAPFAADEEREPNDVDSDALPVAPGKPMRGQLSRAADEDRWRFDGPAGRYEIAVSGLTIAHAQVQVGSAAPVSASRSIIGELQPGAMISIRREGDPAGGPLRGADEWYTIDVKPAR